MTAVAFVGIGSNLDDPPRQVANAIDRLGGIDGVASVAASPLYRTPPWGDTDQPEFVNAVARLKCSLSPHGLWQALESIEAAMGRERTERRWGPRVIDLDLLAYGQCRLAGEALRIPHPRLAERAFVLVPWADLAPDFQVPGLGSVDALLARCRQQPSYQAPRPME